LKGIWVLCEVMPSGKWVRVKENESEFDALFNRCPLEGADAMEDLKKMYPAIIDWLKQKGKDEWSRQEVADGFAWLYGITNKKTIEGHLGRMCRLGFLVYRTAPNGGDRFGLGKGPR